MEFVSAVRDSLSTVTHSEYYTLQQLKHLFQN